MNSTMSPASAAPVKPPPEATRPRFFDYLLILVGIAGSVFLGELSGLRARAAQPDVAPWEAALERAFPKLLLLPLGVVLVWPLFYLNQKILGRKRELTWAEWLWGLAWLGSLALAAWLVLNGLDAMPSFMTEAAFKNGVLFAYVLFVLSMGGLAALLFLVSLVGSRALPWTHMFGLALLMWPLLPLAAWWLLGMKLEL
jgi:hypothetical protein